MTPIALFLFIIFGIPVICGTLITIVAMLKRKTRDGDLSADETRLLQEIHLGMTKMEKRIESLETIVINQEKQREHSEL